MSVEDDPSYSKWRAVLERLIAAKHALRVAVTRGDPIEPAELELARARQAYFELADEV